MGRPRKFFDGACRVRDWRANSAPKAAAVTEVQVLHLTFAVRQALQAEIDRRRRAALAEADRDEAKRLLAMFADEVPA